MLAPRAPPTAYRTPVCTPSEPTTFGNPPFGPRSTRYGKVGDDYAARDYAALERANTGALHVEKYYHTVAEAFAAGRARFRWNHVVALGRVTASEQTSSAPGLAQARELPA